ncbi:hypothetical protein QQS21_009262 [Conoideocrella luteorostrata]|uniref:Uncharacterized protein n=1 Tax=Conoideocrella luteorostrata TaxID=1105319 RepID=A0AAJ0FV79_9HYPO|nr:hypothetical protein QQS21_009262 [Conoideocrella luteorostrata]
MSRVSMRLDDFAAASEAKAHRMRQILIALYNNGIFRYDGILDTYSNNHVSSLLARDHWTHWHNWVNPYGNEFYDIARGIPGSVRSDTERPAAQLNFNTDDDMFAYFNTHGWVDASPLPEPRRRSHGKGC